MAHYEYKCSCGESKIVEQSIHAETKESIKCSCGKKAKRVFNTFAAVFHGTGWGGK